MTAQLPSRERLEERIRAEIELLEISLKNGGSDSPHNDEELLEVFRLALAAHEQEPEPNYVGSKNALDAIVAFIKSSSNPTLSDYNSVSERLFADNCQSLSSHVIEYITHIGEALEDLRQDASHPAPVPAVPECFQRLLHHAEGMSMGIDWNNGTAAGHHREKMLEAVQDCCAMLNGGKS